MTESELYQTILKPMFCKMDLFFKRVEYPTFPDIVTSKNGTDCWLEMKCINHKAMDLVKPDWRTGQLSWIREYKTKGGAVFLVLWYCGEVFFLEPKKEYQKEELICQKKIFLKMFSPK